ncbi:MAG: Hsp20/alpha crystallin family protein [Planctomycetes bacterium]|nr:Hsp20/alpha crystallin family protein [Planctomycetota bacterium]
MSQMKLRDPFDMGGMRNLLRSFFDDAGFQIAPTLEEGALAVDISEGKEGETIVRASLPGFKKEDVKISVHQGILDIRAESKEETETRDEKFYRKERRWGAVSRRIALPGNPAEDGVQAELKDGVLTVKVQPSKANQPRQIAVR